MIIGANGIVKLLKLPAAKTVSYHTSILKLTRTTEAAYVIFVLSLKSQVIQLKIVNASFFNLVLPDEC